jgi:hypothetical protein
MKMFSFLSLAAAAILIVSLGMTTLAFSKQSRDVTAQLERARSELRDLRMRGRGAPLTWDESLRDILGQQNAPTPGWRGGFGRFGQGDRMRFQQFAEARERRRQATELWFRETTASLDERARQAASPEAATVASEISGTLARLNELRVQWDSIRGFAEDDRRAAAEQLHRETTEAMNRLRELRERDRQLQLAELARSVGLTNEPAVQDFVSRVTGLYQRTEYNPAVSTNRAPAAATAVASPS